MDIYRLTVHCKQNAKVKTGLRRMVNQGLQGLQAPLNHNTPGHFTRTTPLYERDEVNPVFLSRFAPMLVNNSSISMTVVCGGSGGVAGGLWARARTHGITLTLSTLRKSPMRR